MVTDFCMDLIFCIGETEFTAKRCVQCGEIVDPVILENRRTGQKPMMGRSENFPDNSVESLGINR